MFCCALLCVHSSFCNHLDGVKTQKSGYFALFVFLVSHDCCVAVLPYDATALPAVCDCGIF